MTPTTLSNPDPAYGAGPSPSPVLDMTTQHGGHVSYADRHTGDRDRSGVTVSLVFPNRLKAAIGP